MEHIHYKLQLNIANNSEESRTAKICQTAEFPDFFSEWLTYIILTFCVIEYNLYVGPYNKTS